MDKVLVIVGPTASGKTATALKLAKQFNGEIISGDAFQVYQNCDIGTAKIEDQQGIVHHLLDVVEYDQSFDVKCFQTLCRQAIAQIVQRGKLPIICGGTGLYLKAALYDYEFGGQVENRDFSAWNNEQLYERLSELDPISARKIHPHNRKRLERALNLALSGESKSSREQKQQHQPLYDVYWYGLDVNREELKERINRRVDLMVEQGLVQEVKMLFEKEDTWTYQSFQAIGYKEFLPYFKHEVSLEKVIEQIKTDTRRYAKRQMTWFKHQVPVDWQADVERVKAWIECMKEPH